MVAAPAASPVSPMETPSAAELIGRVRIIPIRTDTAIPPRIGDASTLIFTRFPSHFIKLEIGGPTINPATAPVQMDTSGVKIISIFVLPAPSLPHSMPIRAATKAPRGSPAFPNAKLSIPSAGNAPIIPATAAETVTSGPCLNFAATPTPIPAPVTVFATLEIAIR